MATFYILCAQRDGFPIEDVTDDMRSTEDWAVSGRIWRNREHAEMAARDFIRSLREGESPVMLRTVEL